MFGISDLIFHCKYPFLKFVFRLASTIKGYSYRRRSGSMPKTADIIYHRIQKEIRTLHLSVLDSDLYCLVPVAGVEPAPCRQDWILSPARLPIPSHRLFGFRQPQLDALVAVRCVQTGNSLPVRTSHLLYHSSFSNVKY